MTKQRKQGSVIEVIQQFLKTETSITTNNATFDYSGVVKSWYEVN